MRATCYGLDEAFRRAELYLKSGADGIFIESPHDVAELEMIGKKFDVPQMANMLEGGQHADPHAARARRHGLRDRDLRHLAADAHGAHHAGRAGASSRRRHGLHRQGRRLRGIQVDRRLRGLGRDRGPISGAEISRYIGRTSAHRCIGDARRWPSHRPGNPPRSRPPRPRAGPRPAPAPASRRA